MFRNHRPNYLKWKLASLDDATFMQTVMQTILAGQQLTCSSRCSSVLVTFCFQNRWLCCGFAALCTLGPWRPRKCWDHCRNRASSDKRNRKRKEEDNGLHVARGKEGKEQNDEQSALLQKTASSQLIKQLVHSIRQLCTLSGTEV